MGRDGESGKGVSSLLFSCICTFFSLSPSLGGGGVRGVQGSAVSVGKKGGNKLAVCGNMKKRSLMPFFPCMYLATRDGGGGSDVRTNLLFSHSSSAPFLFSSIFQEIGDSCRVNGPSSSSSSEARERPWKWPETAGKTRRPTEQS